MPSVALKLFCRNIAPGFSPNGRNFEVNCFTVVIAFKLCILILYCGLPVEVFNVISIFSLSRSCVFDKGYF